jgi:Pyridoxal-phosphate dependent enzyme
VASRFAPAAKLDRIRALDARLELVDGDFDTARERAAAIARHDGIRLVEDSADIETCEGAATIGLELAGTAPSFDAVLIALGGGALATGVGHVLKARAPGVEVVCVQPLGAPAMTRSWRQRRVVTTGPTDTIADGVAGRGQRLGLDHRVVAGVTAGGAGLPAAVGRVAVNLQPGVIARVLRACVLRLRAVLARRLALGRALLRICQARVRGVRPARACCGSPIGGGAAETVAGGHLHPVLRIRAARPGGHRHLAVGDQPGLRLGRHMPAEPVPAASAWTCGYAGPGGPRC